MRTSVAFIFAVLAIAMVSAVRQRTPTKGKCPVLPFVDNFDARKFVGKWYVVKETDKDYPCVSFDIKKTRPYTYKAEFKAIIYPLKFNIELDKKSVDDTTEGFIVSAKKNPFMDGGDMRIFSIDYGKKRVKMSLYFGSINANIFRRSLCRDLRLQGNW